MGDIHYRRGLQPLHAYLRLNGREHPDEPAVIWYGRAITWQELDAWSDEFAAFLSDHGVQPGDRVALYLQNCPQYLVAHYAAQKIGAIVGPCSPLFKQWELAYEVADLGAKVIVASDLGYEVVAQVRKQLQDEDVLETVVVTSYADFLPDEPSLPLPEDLRFAKTRYPMTYDLLAILNNPDVPEHPPEVEIQLDDTALLVYTSGTTGRPKGAMLSHRSALYKTAAGSDANGVQRDDVLLAVMPLCHIAGMLLGVNVPVYTRRPVVLLYRFDPETVMQAIERFACTWWYSTAPMNVAVLNAPGRAEHDLTSLRKNLCTSFGMALTEELGDTWRAATGGCVIHEAAYGLSETHTGDTYMPADAIRWGTVGVPVAQTEIRIAWLEAGAVGHGAGSDDVPVATGEQGEIVIKSPGVFQGYWHRPDATAQVLHDGWLHTGDIGSLDEAGYLTFHGRLKELIKVSGYSVFPEDVESILIRHPTVAQAAVIGVPDERKGEAVKAFVVFKPGAAVDADSLRAWAHDNMAPYKVPREVEFRDSLPASGTGKVLRRLLVEER